MNYAWFQKVCCFLCYILIFHVELLINDYLETNGNLFKLNFLDQKIENSIKFLDKQLLTRFVLAIL